MSGRFNCARYSLKRISREETAFILLEVLLALTLTGVLFILLTPALTNLNRFLFRGDAILEHNRIQRLLYRKIAATLDNVYWYPYYDGKLPRFTGDEKGFSVPAVGEEGLGEAEFQLSGGELIYSWSLFPRFDPPPAMSGAKTTVILTDQLLDPSFSYLDGKSGVWRSVWTEEYYPRLVRFTGGLRHRSGQETLLVPLVFPVRAGQDDGRE